ncbi:IS630 transposase-related protein [Bergeriella denitrificans]|uniref:IS630 transposase-related protein n=1 Tax=Bergeriella denitrificans TaxID=494 RepID=UPI000E1BA2A1|nr:IS630 transposase-related protein [Bergeriella denitrificans]
MAYSKDFRQQVLKQLSNGKTYRQLSAEYNISPNTILNWQKQPTKQPYPKNRQGKIDLVLLHQDVQERPDDFQRQRAFRFNCSQRAISKALKRLNITRKKSG